MTPPAFAQAFRASYHVPVPLTGNNTHRTKPAVLPLPAPPVSITLHCRHPKTKRSLSMANITLNATRPSSVYGTSTGATPVNIAVYAYIYVGRIVD